MKTNATDYKCCCCPLWVGILIIGLFTFFELLNMIGQWMQCMEYNVCAGRDYFAWLSHLIILTSFLILAVSRGSLPARLLLRNACILETAIIFIWMTIGAITWIPMEYTKKVCELTTHDRFKA